MVKAKRRQPTLATNKDDTLCGLVESSISRAEGDFHEDDDWVIVKKQRITILIPPLPSVQRLQHTTPQGPRTNKMQPKSKKTVNRRQPQIPSERQLRKHSSDDELQKSDALITSKGVTQINGKKLASPPNLKNLTKRASRSTPKDPGSLIGNDSTYIPTSITHVHDKRVSGGGYGSLQAAAVSGVWKAVNKNTRLTAATNFRPQETCRSQGPSRLFFKPSSCCLNVGVGVFQQNQNMRASNLERKLKKAGGLSRWLVSLKLGQFVQMFRSRNVNDKFQLLNLTMGKLKEMGAIAVGPRRKLMHAIDCLLFRGCTLTSKVLENRVLGDQRYGWDLG